MKYPKTPHLPWSENLSRDDKRIESMERLESSEIIVTEKLDGENTSLHTHFYHARSENSPSGAPWRVKVRELHNQIGSQIPEALQICGEYMYAKHSILYTNLTDYFYVFGIIDKKEEKVLSWAETLEYSELLGLSVVPVLFRGAYKNWDKALPTQSYFGKEIEGYVIRYSGKFPLREFPTNVAKFARADHVQTDRHWTKNWEKNILV